MTSKKTPGQQGEPEDEPERPESRSDDDGQLPDLSEMTTAFLAPTQPLSEERRRKIAEHKREDLKRYRAELDAEGTQHDEALKWPRKQE